MSTLPSDIILDLATRLVDANRTLTQIEDAPLRRERIPADEMLNDDGADFYYGLKDSLSLTRAESAGGAMIQLAAALDVAALISDERADKSRQELLRRHRRLVFSALRFLKGSFPDAAAELEPILCELGADTFRDPWAAPDERVKDLPK